MQPGGFWRGVTISTVPDREKNMTKTGPTHSRLGSDATFAVDPDVLGHDVAILGEAEELLQVLGVSGDSSLGRLGGRIAG